MTDVLRETLEERGRARAWEDVESLMAAGDRRVRRRRVTGAVAGAAAVAALALATPYVVGAVGRDDAQVATPSPFDVSQPSWVDGSVLHVGGDTLALDSYPQAYVLTDDAAVVTAADGTVELYDGDGATAIGTIGGLGTSELVADGSLVAWHDGTSDVVVYDTAARKEVRRVAAPMPDIDDIPVGIPAVEALDGDDLWYSSLDEVHGVDLGTGQEFRTIVPGDAEYVSLVDAADGRVAVYRAGLGVRVTARDGEPVLGFPRRAWDLRLSPNGSLGAWVVRAGDLGVHDSEPGAEPGTLIFESGYESVEVTRWLDDDRFQAVGGTTAPRVLVCSRVTASCDAVATDVAASELVVPDGSAAHSYG